MRPDKQKCYQKKKNQGDLTGRVRWIKLREPMEDQTTQISIVFATLTFLHDVWDAIEDDSRKEGVQHCLDRLAPHVDPEQASAYLTSIAAQSLKKSEQTHNQRN